MGRPRRSTGDSAQRRWEARGGDPDDSSALAVWEGGLGIPGGILVGNWFNQELFGRPTDLPWGLRIDEAHRPDGLEGVALYHPTFLYEALWNLALAAGLVWVGRRWNARPGQLFTAYVVGYAAGRFWVEALRIDTASEILGLRVSSWVSGLTFVVAVTVLARRARSHDRSTEPSQSVERDEDDQELSGEREVDDLADVGFRPPLPQEDRLCRHPSEYSGNAHDENHDRQPRWLRRRRMP